MNNEANPPDDLLELELELELENNPPDDLLELELELLYDLEEDELETLLDEDLPPNANASVVNVTVKTTIANVAKILLTFIMI